MSRVQVVLLCAFGSVLLMGQATPVVPVISDDPNPTIEFFPLSDVVSPVVEVPVPVVSVPVEVPVEDPVTAIQDVVSSDDVVEESKLEVPPVTEEPKVEASALNAPVITATPTVVAIKPPETDAEAGEAIGKVVDLAEQGAWAAMVGFLLMLIVWFLRRINLLSKIPTKAVPWVTMLLGCLTAVGMVLAGGASWTVALTTGIGGGFMAPALWEMLFKHIDKGQAKAKGPQATV